MYIVFITIKFNTGVINFDKIKQFHFTVTQLRTDSNTKDHR